MALNGLFSPLSLKEPDSCVHPKEVCSSSAGAHSSSAAGTEPSLHGAEAGNAPPASADGFVAAALSLNFLFYFFFVWGQHLAALCTILLPSLKSTVQPGAVPLANVPGPEHPPPVPAWTSPCPGTVPLAFGAGSSKPVLLLMHEAADDGDDLIRASGLFLCRWHRYQRSQLCWWCRQ